MQGRRLPGFQPSACEMLRSWGSFAGPALLLALAAVLVAATRAALPAALTGALC